MEKSGVFCYTAWATRQVVCSYARFEEDVGAVPGSSAFDVSVIRVCFACFVQEVIGLEGVVSSRAEESLHYGCDGVPGTGSSGGRH